MHPVVGRDRGLLLALCAVDEDVHVLTDPPLLVEHPARDGRMRALERAHPPIAGWVLDEQRQIREHVNVFVNGTQGEEQTPVAPDDRVHVLPAITGG